MEIFSRSKIIKLSGRVNVIKGRTIRAPPEKANFKNLKQKQELRELIVHQQREIDRELMSGYIKKSPRGFELLKARQRAEQAKKGFVRHQKIEVINENDFKGWKKKAKAQQKQRDQYYREQMWDKRTAQKKIYANDILKYKAIEKKSIIKQGIKNRDDLYFLRRIPGNFLEHQYVWRENDKRQQRLKNTISPVDKYLNTRDAVNYEEKRRARFSSTEGPRRNPVIEHADTVSAQWMKHNRHVFSAEMDKQNAQRKAMTGPGIKKTLRNIETKPQNIEEVLRDYIPSQENYKSQPQAHVSQTTRRGLRNYDDDDSDDDWDVEIYRRTNPTGYYSTQNNFSVPNETGPWKNYSMADLDGLSPTSTMRRSDGFRNTGNSLLFASQANSTSQSTKNKKQVPMSISKRFAKGELEYNDKSLRSTGLHISQRATSTHTRSTRDRFHEEDQRYGVNDEVYQADLKRALNLVKIEQDKEIMGLIYEEQRREAERADLLSHIRAPTMKKDMEEVFHLERQDSQKKIFKRLNSQDNVYENLRNGYVNF